ncbi:hypothetical protein FNH09_44315 [Streptomyces adustus]|uniref:Uncharacterized protein n=1 Tax=Streptomyces adustus TaxID=1609272 RepID=A0A5N8VRS2_9ACTN|nr:hypothetical protein [Streptomyces adustus]MPY37990.1 hypothetical protein [Streptomyces adustus]
MAARRATWPGLNRSAAAASDHRTVELLDAVLAGTAGREVDVLTAMRAFTARSIAEYCFGADSTGVPDLLHETIHATQAFTESSYEFPWWLPLPRHRRFFRTVRRLTEAQTGIVRRRRAPDAHAPGACAPHSDLLGFLLDADPVLARWTWSSSADSHRRACGQAFRRYGTDTGPGLARVGGAAVPHRPPGRRVGGVDQNPVAMAGPARGVSPPGTGSRCRWCPEWPAPPAS